MIEWPLEDVAASVADIKVPHPCILYFVYFENLFEPFQFVFNLLLIFFVFLWYNSNLGQISLNYFSTTLYEISSKFSSMFADVWIQVWASFYQKWSARCALLRSSSELRIKPSLEFYQTLSTSGLFYTSERFIWTSYEFP